MAPNRAVRTQGTRKTITLLFEGREIPVVVTTGLANEQYTEIVSATSDNTPVNLQEGDTVILNTTTTNSGQGNFGPGGGFIFGGGPPPGGR